MVLQNYQNFTEMTWNMIYIVAFGVGLKCSHKIHLNTKCPPSFLNWTLTFGRFLWQKVMAVLAKILEMLTIKVFHFWFCSPNDVNNIKPEKQEVFIRQCFASDLALFIKRDVCSTPQSTGLIEYWMPVTFFLNFH